MYSRGWMSEYDKTLSDGDCFFAHATQYRNLAELTL